MLDTIGTLLEKEVFIGTIKYSRRVPAQSADNMRLGDSWPVANTFTV